MLYTRPAEQHAVRQALSDVNQPTDLHRALQRFNNRLPLPAYCSAFPRALLLAQFHLPKPALPMKLSTKPFLFFPVELLPKEQPLLKSFCEKPLLRLANVPLHRHECHHGDCLVEGRGKGDVCVQLACCLPHQRVRGPPRSLTKRGLCRAPSQAFRRLLNVAEAAEGAREREEGGDVYNEHMEQVDVLYCTPLERFLLQEPSPDVLHDG